jgi:hypothetical protein
MFQSPVKTHGNQLIRKLNSLFLTPTKPLQYVPSQSSIQHPIDKPGCRRQITEGPKKKKKTRVLGFSCKCCPKRYKRFDTLEELK